MKVLIAGGTGVIGKRTVKLLIDQGYEVGVITRTEEKSRWIEAQGATSHQINIFDREQVLEVAQQYNGLIHLATAIPRQTKTKAKDWEINTKLRLEGTDNLLKAAVRHKLDFYIQESYIGIYGHHGDEQITENKKLELPVATRYKLSKGFQRVFDSLVEMEKKVLETHDQHGLNTIIMRFGILYSYDSTNIPSIAQGQFPVVDENAYWSLISADDAAHAILSAIESYANLSDIIFNIVDDFPVRAGTLLDYSARYIGKKKARRVPKFLVRLFFGKFALNYLTTSQKISNKLAREKLNWKPHYSSYKEGFPIEIDRWIAHAKN